jgi:hypothetical protein
MFRSAVTSARTRRPGWIAVVVGVISASTVYVQAQQAQPAAQNPAAQAPAAPAQPAKSPYIFASDAALILNFIKADKAADFEMVVGKLKEALAKSEEPERKQQAASWRFFKVSEPGPNGSTIYISLMEPAVKGADYSVVNVLNEAFPTEIQALYKTYSEAFGTPSQNFLSLNLLSNLGK